MIYNFITFGEFFCFSFQVESKVKITILPCKNVVSNLKIDINTLKNNLENKSKLCNYLIKRFYNDGYHGVQESRVIWDISVIAYMINKNWFDAKEISCPSINEDSSYELTDNKYTITFVTKLDRDKIYEDLLLRHGVFAKTHYHIEETMKLKEYFDNLLGYNLYDLFPEKKKK